MRLRSLTILLLFILILVWNNCFAVMPKANCKSICLETASTSKLKKQLPSGAHCARLKNITLYYRTMGNGNPTIIFSSGTGFSADDWYRTGIPNKLAEKMRVFTYDRIFTFNSCPNVNNFMPVTALDVVNQLHQLLIQEKIKPPYILVGHSFGGLYMLLYARMYPQEVAGLLLMDPTPDIGPTPLPKEAKTILKILGNPQNPNPDDQLYNEMVGQLPSYLQIKQAPPLQKQIPLVVIYATKHCLPIAWTKKLMCMTPSQEEEHKKREIAIYNMSDLHELIRVNEEHMSFFSKENYPTVIKAFNSILELTASRNNTKK